VDGSPDTQRKGDCAWCGAPLADGKRLKGRVVCEACGVANADPWPSESELDRAYEGSYRPRSGRFSGPGDALLERTRAALARRLDRVAPPGRILDVGAGEGTLLDALAVRGRIAVGIERSSSRPDMTERGLGELDGTWAAVVFWHSLEHLSTPATALREAAALLLPGGVLVVAVPNSASVQARVFGNRWFALDPPRHLVHLTAGALIARIGALGLRVERVSYLRGGQVLYGWLDGLVGGLPGRPSLYDAIRRPQARFRSLSPFRRLATLLAAAILFPLALAAGAVEVLLRRGGTVYVEARAA
jgi:SAM-dependent methyltransferase